MNDENINNEQSKKLVDEELMNKTLDENVQQMINKPQADPTGIGQEDREFIENVMKLINDGTIELHTPSTLMNKQVYEIIDEKCQGIADMNAVHLLADLRQIKKLYETEQKESYQIQNLIHKLRMTKERLEKECGDVYII